MAGKISIEDHDVGSYNKVTPMSDSDEGSMKMADVTPLHPPGTFADNTRIGDVVNGLASSLGVKPPKNIIKFPGRK